jgi:hypothetical protein
LSQFEPNWSKFIWFEPIWTKLDQASLHKLKKTLASDYLVPHCIVFYSQRVIVKDQEGTFFENDDKNRGVFFLSVLTDGIREVAWRLQSTRKQGVFHFLGFTVVCILVRISLFQDSEENIHSTLQMFTGNYWDSTGKSECRDFKFMGIACIPAIPVISQFR